MEIIVDGMALNCSRTQTVDLKLSGMDSATISLDGIEVKIVKQSGKWGIYSDTPIDVQIPTNSSIDQIDASNSRSFSI